MSDLQINGVTSPSDVIRSDRHYKRIIRERAWLVRLHRLLSGVPQRDVPSSSKEFLLRIDSDVVGLTDALRQYDRRFNKDQLLPLLQIRKLPFWLIQARLARGMTQKDLAFKLGIRREQIARYERTMYAGASLSRILQVIDVLLDGITAP